MDDKGFDPNYDDYKESNTLHVGKLHNNPDGSSYRKVELILDQKENYASKKNKEASSQAKEFEVLKEVVLYESHSGQQKIHCWLMQDKDQKYIRALNISRRTEKGAYGSQEVTLNLEAVCGLKQFLDNLFLLDSSKPAKFKIPLSMPNSSIKPSYTSIINKDEFLQLIHANIRNTDDFYSLLAIQKKSLAVERFEKIVDGDYKNEAEIQKFLQQNIWMFGNEYTFVVEENKINAQNILDIIPQDIESFIDIIEVKLPNEALFNFDSSHNNFYCKSALTKAIAQTQNYIFELENKSNDEQYQKKNGCRIIKPRGIILFGSKKTLSTEEIKYLRILNSSYHNMQIITYQQLLIKAKNSIKYNN